jgi:hypothetical protein
METIFGEYISNIGKGRNPAESYGDDGSSRRRHSDDGGEQLSCEDYKEFVADLNKKLCPMMGIGDNKEAHENKQELKKNVQFADGAKILQAFEMADEGLEIQEIEMEGKTVLSEEAVKKIKLAKNMVQKKSNHENWGPVLVERKRRKQTTGSMLQKDMKLEHKKNLDPIKGNPFAALSYDSLNQITRDASIKIGFDDAKNCMLLDNLVKYDKEQYEHFVGENHESLLLDNLDTEFKLASGLIEGHPDHVIENTPTDSIKESDTSKLWTEVVKRGKRKNKTRSRSEKLFSMKGAFLNIRGMNKIGRFKCLTDFISTYKLDFVGIQETNETSFGISELNEQDSLELYSCCRLCWWYPSRP